jgi:hypothetical protein
MEQITRERIRESAAHVKVTRCFCHAMFPVHKVAGARAYPFLAAALSA